MSATQPQLLQIPLNPGDVVYTPDWVARDMVEYFKPTGRILEPCSGDGAFLKYLPTADWCEITKGRDFFACHEHYDWIVGNPPYCFGAKWLRHSFEIADNIVYLLPIHNYFVSSRILKDVTAFGFPEIAVYHESLFRDWTIGFVIGALHFRRGYTGPINVVFRDRPKP
jgi:hypothetical protein